MSDIATKFRDQRDTATTIPAIAKGAGFPMTPPNPAVNGSMVGQPTPAPSFLDALRAILMPKKPVTPPTMGILGDRG